MRSGCCCGPVKCRRRFPCVDPRFLTWTRFHRPNSAKPATAPVPAFVPGPGKGPVTVWVLDTGLLSRAKDRMNANEKGPGPDVTDADGSNTLDTQSGHGTFIGSLIRRTAPDAAVYVGQVLDSFGEGDDDTVVKGLQVILGSGINVDVLSLSFGSYTMDDAGSVLVNAILERMMGAGTVVVASAGHDLMSRPIYPAALPGVIGVAALERDRPASFTNWGPWVRACTVGVDVLGMFVERPDSPSDGPVYNGWATWSGTSFAAPRVAAAIALEIHQRLGGATSVPSDLASEVVFDLVDSSNLFRLPCLGTVLNIP